MRKHFVMGSVPLGEEPGELACPPPSLWDEEWEGVPLRAGGKGPDLASTLILDTSASGISRNKRLSLKPPTLWYRLVQPELR